MFPAAFHASMARLAKKIGPEVYQIDIVIDPSNHFIASTNYRNLKLSQQVIAEDADNTEVYVAHEILHHVVDDVEGLHRYPGAVQNYALDYKINQMMEELLGYDVTAVRFKGLRERKYDKLSIRQIARRLHAKGEQSYHHPMMGPAPQSIIAAAEAFKRRYNIDPRPPLFKMEPRDRELYRTHIAPAVREGYHLRNFTNVDVDRTLEGLYAHLVLENAVAVDPPASLRLGPSAALAYAADADRWRKKTVGEPAQAITIATSILGALDEDRNYIHNRKMLATYRRDRLQEELSIRRATKKREKYRSRSMRELKDMLARTEATIQKWQTMVPLDELLRKRKLRTRPTRKVKMPTLRLAQQRVDQGDVTLPNYVEDVLSRRIVTASRRSRLDVEDYLEASESIKSRLRSIIKPLTNRDPSEDGEPVEGPGGSDGQKAGKDRGSMLTREVESERLILHNAQRLLYIIEVMNEVEAALSSKPRKRVEESPQIPIGLGFGDDLSNVDPSEFALLANPETELDFYVKLSQSALTQWQPIEKRQSALVMLIDTSGSMAGQRLDTAIGVALAVANKMAQYRRGFAIVLFESVPYAELVFENKPSLIDLLKLLQKISMGGTNFQAAIERGLDIRDRQGWTETTVMMVTDGEDDVHDLDTIVDRLGRKDKLNALLIGGARMGAKAEQLFHDVYRARRSEVRSQLISLVKRIV